MLTILEQDRFERRAHAMIATMGAFGQPSDNRRDHPRHRMLTRGTLQAPNDRAIVLYTRDATEHGVGVLAVGDLAPNTRGLIEFPGPDGEPVAVVGEVVRTRTLGPGWHEGYVRFDTPVELFCEKPIRAA
jgi:hypothetical protein